MQALKFIKTIKKNKIVLNIPDEFETDDAEIIVLPYRKKEKDLQALLNVSIWSAEDVKGIEEAIEGFKNWKIEAF